MSLRYRIVTEIAEVHVDTARIFREVHYTPFTLIKMRSASELLRFWFSVNVL